MNNYEIIAAFHDARHAVENLSGFTTNIRSLAKRRDGIMESLTAISLFDNKQSNHLASLSNNLTDAQADMKKMSSRKFFANASDLTLIFRELLRQVSEAEPLVSKILSELNHLQNAFDEYTQQHTSSRVLTVVMRAYDFVEQLDTFEKYVEFIGAALSLDDEPKEYEDTLSLYLPASLTFEEFISRLDSINLIYRELADIVGISTSSEPLRIGKVESGSLWATVFGNSILIGLFNDLLRGGAKYWQRNRSPEGRMSGIPTSIKAMDDLFEFSKKLQDAGVDVKPVHEQLAKGAVTISKNINSLLESQSLVIINGEDIPLVENNDRRALQNRQVPQLGNDQDRGDE